MSYSETITKADLTNILNKVLPIRSNTTCTTVTLPFTPTANGLMIAFIRNTSNGRAYQNFTNTIPSFVDNYTLADDYWSQVVYVSKGNQVALSTASNVKSVTCYYIPLDDIASANLYASDYIVEQGTSGIWTYRKWNSGIAECWGEYDKSVTGVSMTAPFSGYNFDLGTIPFPTGLFNAKPVCTVSGRKNGNYTCVSYSNPSSTGISVEFQSSVSGTATCEAHIHAKGKWK